MHLGALDTVAVRLERLVAGCVDLLLHHLDDVELQKAGGRGGHDGTIINRRECLWLARQYHHHTQCLLVHNNTHHSQPHNTSLSQCICTSQPSNGNAVVCVHCACTHACMAAVGRAKQSDNFMHHTLAHSLNPTHHTPHTTTRHTQASKATRRVGMTYPKADGCDSAPK